MSYLRHITHTNNSTGTVPKGVPVEQESNLDAWKEIVDDYNKEKPLKNRSRLLPALWLLGFILLTAIAMFKS